MFAKQKNNITNTDNEGRGRYHQHILMKITKWAHADKKNQKLLCYKGCYNQAKKKKNEDMAKAQDNG